VSAEKFPGRGQRKKDQKYSTIKPHPGGRAQPLLTPMSDVHSMFFSYCDDFQVL